MRYGFHGHGLLFWLPLLTALSLPAVAAEPNDPTDSFQFTDQQKPRKGDWFFHPEPMNMPGKTAASKIFRGAGRGIRSGFGALTEPLTGSKKTTSTNSPYGPTYNYQPASTGSGTGSYSPEPYSYPSYRSGSYSPPPYAPRYSPTDVQNSNSCDSDGPTDFPAMSPAPQSLSSYPTRTNPRRSGMGSRSSAPQVIPMEPGDTASPNILGGYNIMHRNGGMTTTSGNIFGGQNINNQNGTMTTTMPNIFGGQNIMPMGGGMMHTTTPNIFGGMNMNP